MNSPLSLPFLYLTSFIYLLPGKLAYPTQYMEAISIASISVCILITNLKLNLNELCFVIKIYQTVNIFEYDRFFASILEILGIVPFMTTPLKGVFTVDFFLF